MYLSAGEPHPERGRHFKTKRWQQAKKGRQIKELDKYPPLITPQPPPVLGI